MALFVSHTLNLSIVYKLFNIKFLILYFNLISTEWSDNSGIEDREEEYAWLDVIDQPDNLYMQSGIYMGPAVQACFLSILNSYAGWRFKLERTLDFATNIKFIYLGSVEY
jgi:hypothetical protein